MTDSGTARCPTGPAPAAGRAIAPPQWRTSTAAVSPAATIPAIAASGSPVTRSRRRGGDAAHRRVREAHRAQAVVEGPGRRSRAAARATAGPRGLRPRAWRRSRDRARPRRGAARRTAGGQRNGRAGDPRAVARERPGARRGEVRGAGVDLGDRKQAQLHRGDHPEAATAAAQRPEEVGVLVGGRGDDAPSAVTTSARRRLSAAKPCSRASQRTRPHRACSPRRRRQATRRQQRGAERRGRGEHVDPPRARADARDPALRVDEDVAQPAGADEDPAVGRDARAVAGGLHGEGQVVLAGGDDRGPHVGGAVGPRR